MPKRFYQSENDSLDYTFNFANWLAEGQTISNATISTPANNDGFTAVVDTVGSSAVKFRAQGGVAEAEYEVTCTVTCNNSEVKEAKMYINILPF